MLEWNNICTMNKHDFENPYYTLYPHSIYKHCTFMHTTISGK